MLSKNLAFCLALRSSDGDVPAVAIEALSIWVRL
jgi:hypothetical protein